MTTFLLRARHRCSALGFIEGARRAESLLIDPDGDNKALGLWEID